MSKSIEQSLFVATLFLLAWLVPLSSATAANEVFLSTDTAESEATYVVQFETTIKGHIDKIRVALPPGANAANARLGRLIIGDKVFQGNEDDQNDATLSLDLLDANTLIVNLRDERDVKPGTRILVELFNLHNPVEGIYSIDVTTLGKTASVIEVIPPIGYRTFGDITAVNTPMGSGLAGGATSGDVTLSLQSCPAGRVLKSLGSSWACAPDNDSNSGGTVTSVGTGAGLIGGPITTTGTISVATGGIGDAMIADWAVTNSKLAPSSVDSSKIVDGSIGSADVNTAEIQRRVTGACVGGSAIQIVNQTGTVSCRSFGSGTVTFVGANTPLTVTNPTTTPTISLPDVKIDGLGTAIGVSALLNNTTGNNNTAIGGNALLFNTAGSNNTAGGVNVLLFNTTGNENTASGVDALRSNTAGNENTATGVAALFFNLTGNQNTASGHQALFSNTTGNENIASGVEALLFNTTGSSNTGSGFNALRLNTTGNENTASGANALRSNTEGSGNTAIGSGADVFMGILTNATAIGANAIVDASNKIRLGDGAVTVVEGAPYSVVSDKTKKENFKLVDGEEVLRKIGRFGLTSWNYIGQDAKQFRHYGPMAQDFFAAFGNDGVGTIGTPTTISSTDMAGILMIAVQTLEKRTVELQAENADLKARLERLEKLMLAKEALAQR